MKVYAVYKKLGQTPLQALEGFKKAKKLSSAAKLTYAGRLDPMAEGVLLILQNATQKQREKFLGLPKVYEAEVLFGFSTDTFDILGLAKKFKHTRIPADDAKEFLTKYKGAIKFPLPAYSSVPVKGKSLFQWAREGRLKEIKIPKREMEILQIKYLGTKEYESGLLLKKIIQRVNKVKGDFRQVKITKNWQRLLGKEKQKYFAIKFVVKCGSGTYIRSLADDMGKRMGTGAVLFSLKRLSVGKYKQGI